MIYEEAKKAFKDAKHAFGEAVMIKSWVSDLHEMASPPTEATRKFLVVAVNNLWHARQELLRTQKVYEEAKSQYDDSDRQSLEQALVVYQGSVRCRQIAEKMYDKFQTKKNYGLFKEAAIDSWRAEMAYSDAKRQYYGSERISELVEETGRASEKRQAEAAMQVANKAYLESQDKTNQAYKVWQKASQAYDKIKDESNGQ